MPPERRLFPDDAGRAAEVESLSRCFDAGLGPDGRRLMYAHMLDQRALMLRFNNQGVPRWEDRALHARLAARVSLGRARARRQPRTEAEDEAWARVFDAVAERSGRPARYLCCDRFSAADLTFAALAASVLVPPGYGVPLPQPDLLPRTSDGRSRSCASTRRDGAR